MSENYRLPFHTGQKLIELGGGAVPLLRPNADFRELPTVDLVFDFEKRFPIPDEIYDGVFAQYVIEHISWRRVKHFVSEIYRILKPGGMAVLVGPNTLEKCKEIIRRNRISLDENAMLYGGQEGTLEETGNYHKSAFSFEYVHQLFKGVGFSDVKTMPLPACNTDMIIEAKKGISQDFVTRVKNSKWFKELDNDLEDKPKENIRLNIGSFTVMLKPPVINLDKLDMNAYAKTNGFLFEQIDVRNGLPYSDNSVEFINASHLIEHLTEDEGKDFLKECRRVLSPNGTLRLGTPDLKKIIDAYMQRDMARFNEHQPIEYVNASSQADQFWRMLTPGHKTIYDHEALVKLLRKTGFQGKRVKYNKRYDMYPDHTLFIAGTPMETPVPPQRKLKIGIISTPFLRTPPDSYGGLEQIVADLAEALAERGQDVTVFAADGSKVKGCKVVEFGPPALKVQVNWLETEKKAYAIYEDKLKEFDIIHDHNWFGFPYIAKTKNPSLKIIHTHHGGLQWKSKPIGVNRLNLVGISDFMARTYATQGFSAVKAYNGINLTRYPFKAEKGDRLLYVGRFSEFKQPHIALEVAKRLDIGIDLVGGTFVDNINYLNDIRNKVGAYPKAKMYEDATHETKLKLMQNAKCLLFPSAMGEPFGLVAIESLACGTPVIASNDGAIPELITTECGIVCNTIKAPDLVEQMIEAVKKINEITPEACRKRAESFSRKVMAQTYLDLYTEVLIGKEW